MIEVRNLVKKYGDHTAVDGLSFHVEKGQIYGFLGPNGAGKSTTMNIITGYIASTEGQVFIQGHDMLTEPEEAKKCIGYLPEQPPLYFDMKVGEYLQFAAQLKKIPKDQRRKQIEEVMKMTGIDHVEHRLIKNLSKGYRQRVGLAQAILGYPEIIILDEPTVGLDPKQMIEMRDLIRRLGEKHTVILSSHILSEVSAVCDYVMIIANGKLAASDTPENLAKMMQGENHLKLEVRGEKERLENLLKNLPQVKEFTLKETEEGTVLASLQTDRDTDIRESLFYMLAEEKCPILQMQQAKVSLEDIFLELTQGDGEKKIKEAEEAFEEDPEEDVKEEPEESKEPAEMEAGSWIEEPAKEEEKEEDQEHVDDM